VSKIFLLICLIISINVKAQAGEVANFEVVSDVKEMIVSFAVKNSTMTEAYSKIKSISLSAISFIQTDGKISSDDLNELVTNITKQLEHEAVFMKKEQVVATIISAINS
jgi:hypothetical protein